MGAVLIVAAVVFAAELGDKSQLMALAFATRYRAWLVLVALAARYWVGRYILVVQGTGIGGGLGFTDAEARLPGGVGTR